jgi:hypothetical protein
MPERLYAATSSRIPKRRTILEARDGAGENMQTLTTSTSTSPGARPVLEERGDGGVEEGVHLVERVLVGGRVLAALEDVARAVALLADSGAHDDPEEEAVLGEAQAVVTQDDVAGHLRAHLAVVGRFVAHVVQEEALRPPAMGDSCTH